MSAYLSAVLADNPLHYWRCADPGGLLFHDIGSSPLHAHGLGVPVLGYTGPVSDGGSADCSLDNNYFNVGDPIAWGGGAFSIEMWVWTWQNLAVRQGIYAVWGVGGNIALFHTLTDYRFTVPGGTAFTVNGYTPKLWHHLAGSIGPAGVQLAVDGTIFSTVASAIPGAFSGLLGFSQGSTLGAVWGDSFFSEVAFYNTQLSGARINAHWAAADRTTQAPIYREAGNFNSASGGNTALGDLLNLVVPQVSTRYQNTP